MRRYTTVELVVDNRPWMPRGGAPDPARLVGVQVRYGPESLRHDVRAAGAT